MAIIAPEIPSNLYGKDLVISVKQDTASSTPQYTWKPYADMSLTGTTLDITQ